MSDKMDMRISGSSTMPGGEYGKVSISGAGKIQGNVKCESLHCSGSAKVQGDAVAEEMHCSGSVRIEGSVVCTGELASSGSMACQGDVKTERMRCSGSFQGEGKLEGGELSLSGALRVGGDVHCRSLRSSGVCRVGGGVEAETVELSGATEIGGLLNAESVTISAGGKSEIGDIGCASIRVRQDQPGRFWDRVLSGHRKSMGLVTGTIEGDTVELEFTQADVVRGKQVVIGEGCIIRRVEYTESCQAEEGTVEELVQV